MNKICTSIEQSKKLIELGIDVNTADMCYRIVAYNPDDTHIYQPYCFIGTLESDISAWSLTTLLKMLPLPTLEETMITTTETKWKCTIYCKSHAKYWSELHDDAIDAAFEMVCWILENEKL